MNVVEAVKQNLTTRQAAEMYGIPVNRHGMAVCPFHNDKNPSTKVDKDPLEDKMKRLMRNDVKADNFYAGNRMQQFCFLSRQERPERQYRD